MNSNVQFGLVLSIIGENGMLDLEDLSNAARTCKDAHAYVGTTMHYYPQSTKMPLPGPHPCIKLYPMQGCTLCKRTDLCFRWPFPPHFEAAVCDDCIERRYNVLGCLTTKYRIRDLSGLPWVPDPRPPYQARFYLKTNIILRALQEHNRPQGFKKVREARIRRLMVLLDKKENRECT
jgi:hypothetical protein